MAVGAEYLGQQVRCPHCQAVVVAPPRPALPGRAATDGRRAALSFRSPTAERAGGHFRPAGADRRPVRRAGSPTHGAAVVCSSPAAARDRSATAPPTPPRRRRRLLAPTLTYPGLPAGRSTAGDATLPSWMDHTPRGFRSRPRTHRGTAEADRPKNPFRRSSASPATAAAGSSAWCSSRSSPIPCWRRRRRLPFYRYRLQEAPPAARPSPLENLPSFDPSDPNHDTHLKQPGKSDSVSATSTWGRPRRRCRPI